MFNFEVFFADLCCMLISPTFFCCNPYKVFGHHRPSPPLPYVILLNIFPKVTHFKIIKIYPKTFTFGISGKKYTFLRIYNMQLFLWKLAKIFADFLSFLWYNGASIFYVIKSENVYFFRNFINLFKWTFRILWPYSKRSWLTSYIAVLPLPC